MFDHMFERLQARASRQQARRASTLARVTVSAHDVAAVLRERLPGLPIKKLHKLLYYCQGHHLAVSDEPLFSETVSAWDMGPVVGTLWHREINGSEAPSRRELSEGQLNTVGYVLSRYGALTGKDLERLTHSETPWQEADRRRHPGESVRIELEQLRAYFRSDGAPDDTDQSGLRLDSDAVHQWLKDADIRRHEARTADTIEALRMRLARSG
jgi:uncharacterized phage-associated protein